MKKLILLALLIPLGLSAKDEILNEVELEKKWVSAVKDAEIEKKLISSTEFQECYKKNKFDPKSPTKDPKTIAAAESCFKEKVSKKSAKDLEDLADKLGLMSYGLIANKNVASITKYLADKMYQSMTGTDRNQLAAEEQLKFKNRKLIDQNVFIDLYLNHLSKKALHEISRFCFENFRNTSATSALTFAEHWKAYFNGGDPGTFTDEGNGTFGTNTEIDVSDKDKSYTAMFAHITDANNQPLDGKKLNNFFALCSSQIYKLCEEFKPKTDSTTKTVKTMSKGANACLTKARLQEIRKVMADSNLIKKQFDEEKDFNMGFEVQTDQSGRSAANPSFYDRGDSNPDNSLDNLTNISSVDVYSGGKIGDESEAEKLARECSENPADKKCDDFFVVDNSRQKVEHSVDMDLRLKKQVELARIKEMDEKPLLEYLETNGYLDLLEDVKKNGKNANLEAGIEKAFDVKRAATIEAIQSKLGARQVTEAEVEEKGRDNLIKKNAKEVQQERARMAQVVLFNNIITSHLTLSKKEGGKDVEVGRNVNAWKKEQKGLESASIQPELFEGLKESAKDAKGTGKNESIQGLSFLDTILSGAD